jgi:hypothetical protein
MDLERLAQELHGEIKEDASFENEDPYTEGSKSTRD